MSTPAQQFLSAHRPFVPRRWLRNGHAMTVFAWARRRAFPRLPTPEARLIQVSDDTQVLVHCYWQTDRASRGTLLALHGLEGSSDAHYMRGLAAKAWDRGWNTVLLNQRNCGGTEHLTPGLYHSGLTADPRAVIEALAGSDGLRAVGLVGYSLGGNLAVRLMGELGDSAALPVVGAVAISPTIDLERCVRAIERRTNLAYQFNFVRNLKGRMLRKEKSWPGAFDVDRLRSIWTIRKFDDVYTAPFHGYAGASDYYHRASAIRLADRIRIPTLILAAEDDPFVPAEQFRDPALRDNPPVAVCVEQHGGHCGFATDPADEDDGYWAEATAIRFLAPLMPR
jgi:predicted alpha/beta-fold hydrolase